MKDKVEKIVEAAQYIKERSGMRPVGGLILGTGLSSLTDNVKNGVSIPYREIPGFPESTAPSHKGELIIGDYGNKTMLIMQGRFHFYEGYSMEQITFPVRVMKELGIEFLIVTNAAGSLNEELQPGSIVLLKDHINFMGTNPLIGPHSDDWGERFPSLNEPYSGILRRIALEAAVVENIKLPEGIYIAVSGPSLETESECRTFSQWGADVVGMSTVPEVIVGVQCGLKILGLSVVTNMSNMFHSEEHHQSSIEETARESYERLTRLIVRTIEKV